MLAKSLTKVTRPRSSPSKPFTDVKNRNERYFYTRYITYLSPWAPGLITISYLFSPISPQD